MFTQKLQRRQTDTKVPAADPVLCCLVWEPHSPMRWWLDTWDMAAGGKGWSIRELCKIWLELQPQEITPMNLPCNREVLSWSATVPQLVYPTMYYTVNEKYLKAKYLYINYLKPMPPFCQYLKILSQKGYLKILFSWSSTSLPGNKGRPALANSGNRIKCQTETLSSFFCQQKKNLLIVANIKQGLFFNVNSFNWTKFNPPQCV